MRILIVSNYYLPYVSGVTEYCHTLARRLVADGCEVEVLTGQYRGDLPPVETIDGVVVRREPINLRLNKGYISLALVKAFLGRHSRFDVVNLHAPMLEAGLFAALSKRPVVLTYQCDMASVGDMVSRLAVAAVQRSLRVAAERSSAVAVLSDDYARSSPILKGIEVTQIRPANRFHERAAQQLSQRLGNSLFELDPRLCHLGFVGRFVAEKGIDILLDAIPLVTAKTVKLHLAGDFGEVAGGSIYEQVRAKIATLGDQVVLLGKLSDDALVDLYNSIDILVLPSVNRFEAFGMVQLEAMSFGAIPVASNMPGVRDVVRDGGVGELADPGNAASLASAIDRAIANRSRVDRYTAARTALERFPATIGENYLETFTRVSQSVAKA